MSGDISSDGEGPSHQSTSQDTNLPMRKRKVSQKKKNFSEQEIEVLVSEVVPRFQDLFGTRKKNVPLGSRNQIWQNIMVAVNAIGVDKRTIVELKKKWNDLRSHVKAKMSLINKHSKGTGGGPAIPIALSAVEEQVAGTYERVQIEGIGEMDTFALSRHAATAEIENAPVENSEIDLVLEFPEEATPDPSVLSTSNTDEGTAFRPPSNLGLNDTQSDFMCDYTQQSISNFKAVVEQLSSVVERLETLNATVSKGLEQICNISCEMSKSLAQLVSVFQTALLTNSNTEILGISSQKGQSGAIGLQRQTTSQLAKDGPASNLNWLHLSTSEGESSGEGDLAARQAIAASIKPSHSSEVSVHPPGLHTLPVFQTPSVNESASASNFLLDVKDRLSTSTCAIPLKKRSRKCRK